MSWFKSKEEKAKEIDDKLKNLNLENLNLEDKEQINLILQGLVGNGLLEVGTIFTGSGEDIAKLGYLEALVSQNWLIIKILNEIKNKKITLT